MTYNAAISSSEKGRQWPFALHLFEDMQTACIRQNVISYNATIAALEKGQQWRQALHLIADMHRAKVNPDAISFFYSIECCEKGQQLLQALHLFAVMHAGALDPDVISQSAPTNDDKGQRRQLLLQLFKAISDLPLQRNVACHFSWLEASHLKAAGYDFLELSMRSSLYTDFFKQEPAILDVYDMPADAAWMAVQHWFAEILPPLLSHHRPRTCIILIGSGKFQELGKQDDQDFIKDMLRSHSFSVVVKRGRLQMRLKSCNLAAFLASHCRSCSGTENVTFACGRKGYSNPWQSLGLLSSSRGASLCDFAMYPFSLYLQ